MSSSDQRSLEKIVKRLRRLTDAAASDSTAAAAAAAALNERKVERCLARLHQMRLSAEQLQLTGLAGTVGRLRKLLRAEAAIAAARRLVKDWRLTVRQAEATAAAEDAKGNAAVVASSECSTSNSSVRNLQREADEKVEERSAAASADTTITSDPMRLKCQEMLRQALEQAQPTPSGEAAEAAAVSPRRIAVEIESALFADFGGGQAAAAAASAKYKTRIRSLLMNLRDPRNPDLRGCLLRGGLAGADAARMTPEQLASDEMKRLREKMVKDSIRLHQAGSAKPEAGSSLFACKRCRKKNCTYNQLQTLPGDEPMTTYVLCNECGFRWKFN